MHNFIISLLTCSVTMSALALLYMAVTPLLTKRYSEKGRYYAWLVVVIGLIVPFRPQFTNAVVKVQMPTEMAMAVIQTANEPLAAVTDVNDTVSPAIQNIAWWQVAAMVWLAGVIAFLAYHLIRHYCFVKMARHWGEKITDEQVLALFASLKAEMGITKRFELYICSSVGGPMMTGFLKPRIFLPTTELSQDELRFILQHELVHHRRKDLLYKYLVLASTAIHWFNPVVYLMAKAIAALCEMSCDAEVVRSADIDTRRHYSETIIGVVKFHSKLKTALSTTFYGGKKSMKNRISSIMDTSKKKAGIAIVSILLFLTMSTGMAFAAGSSANVSVSGNANPSTNEEERAWSENRWREAFAEAERRNPSANEEERLWRESLWREAYEKIAREWAEREEANRESSAKLFSVYEKYGLTYSKETDRLYYNGELVRYFEDNTATEKGTFSGTVHPGIDGNIDVHAVRDSAGKLVGVEPYSKADFDARTKIQKNGTGNVSVSEGSW